MTSDTRAQRLIEEFKVEIMIGRSEEVGDRERQP
jgi:hypothetical protein